LEEAAGEAGVVLTLLEEGQAPRALFQEARLLKGGEVGEEGQAFEAGEGDEAEATGEAPRPAGGDNALPLQVARQVLFQGAPGLFWGHRRKRYRPFLGSKGQARKATWGQKRRWRRTSSARGRGSPQTGQGASPLPLWKRRRSALTPPRVAWEDERALSGTLGAGGAPGGLGLDKGPKVRFHLGWAFGLSEEAFWWQPKEGANPIGGLVRHITGSSLRLGSYALGLPLPEWAKRGREWELQGEKEPKEADLSALVRVGNQGVEAPRAHVLHHLVEHAQHHAGQVIYASKLL